MLRSSLFWAGATRILLSHRRNFVLQTARTDCGVASALTVLKMMGRKADPIAAVDLMDADRAGTNLEALRLYFQDQHGCEARAVAAAADKLRQLKGRVILHMRQMHYVVLLKNGPAGILVFDPAMGPVFYPHADFAKLYSGYALEIKRGKRRSTAVAPTSAMVGGAPKAGAAPLALFVLGVASRLLECAILLCVVAALFLVLNHASFPSIVMIFGLVAVCGGLLLFARQTRFDGEDALVKRKQTRLWRGLLRTSLRGRDLSGFRGRMEKDVSGQVRRGMIVAIPQRAQVPGALGALFGMSALLCVLHPLVALAHLILFGSLLVVTQLDDVQICRLSVRPGIGRYAKLGLGRGLINATIAPDMFAEAAKWVVIGVAGFAVLLSDLPPVALMFWILTAMQIVPLDFRKAMVLAPMLGVREPLSALTASEVPLRRQTVGGPVDLKISQSGGQTRIDGIAPLTATLQQPDLTVREQRLIMADVVRHTLDNMPEEKRPNAGTVRIFAPGQDATQADFEHLMIARESNANDAQSGATLPAVRQTRETMDLGASDPVLRDLHSCTADDFPVFWDFRGRLKPSELQARLGDAGLAQAAHLTMKRLTVIKAA